MDWAWVFGLATSLAGLAAAGAAWWAAATAKRDLEARDLPNIVAYFCRVPYSYGVDSDLGILVANYGGVATNVRLFTPSLVSGSIGADEASSSSDLQHAVLYDIGRVPAFLNGIDVLSPGESIVLPVGHFSDPKLASLFCDQKYDIAVSDSKLKPVRFTMAITYSASSRSDMTKEIIMNLDPTITHRDRSQRP